MEKIVYLSSNLSTKNYHTEVNNPIQRTFERSKSEQRSFKTERQ